MVSPKTVLIGFVFVEFVQVCHAQVSLPFQCTFEEGTCGLEQLREVDHFDWTRLAGPTPSEGTGPGSANHGEYYFYIETDFRNSGDRASFQTPVIRDTGAACLTFFVHMYGETIGSLEVMSSDRSEPWAVISGDQGDRWVNQQIDVQINTNSRILFRSTVGGERNGDIAIDDIRIHQGSCPLFECTFDEGEANTCEMEQQTDDAFDWTWTSTGTPGEDSGPSSAQSPYGYMFTNAQSREAGDTAKINTVSLGHNGPVCVEFWYYVYGSDIGENALQLYTRNAVEGGSEQTIWSLSGSKGQEWFQYKETIFGMTQDISVGWKGTVGGYSGHVAIDSIRLMDGNCPVSSQLPYTCNLEVNFCQMGQRTDDQFDWYRRREATPTGKTGPSRAAEGVYFMYIEADGQREGSRAYLDSPSIRYAGVACIRFAYHMQGASIGGLLVFQSGVGEEQPLLRKIGQQGSDWLHAAIDVTLDDQERITWAGTVGPGTEGDVAVDDISITSGSCSEKTTTTPSSSTRATISPPPPPVRLPYMCDFEDSSLCGVKQLETDEFDWTRIQGGTPTANTGPARAFSLSYYLYIESDPPRATRDKAILETPDISFVGQACLTLQVHMWGTGIGNLVIHSSKRSYTNPFKTISGDKGSAWQEEKVEINIANEKIYIVATVGKDNHGDIAIDKLFIAPEPCTTTSTRVSLPYACDAETDDVCDMQQLQTDQFDFTRQRGPTPTDGTGPKEAYSGRWYLYAEANQRVQGDTAVIETPGLSHDGPTCLKFSLHMSARDSGSLGVYTRTRGDRAWREYTGMQGSDWVAISLSITLGADDKVRFKATRGASNKGDIAIDMIKLDRGNCPDPPTTTTISSPVSVPMSSRNASATTTTTAALTNVTESSTTNFTEPTVPAATTTEPPSLGGGKAYIIVIGVLGAICAALLVVAIVALIYVKILKSRKVGDDPMYGGGHSAELIDAHRAVNTAAAAPFSAPPKGEGLPTMASLAAMPSSGNRAGALPPLRGAAVVSSSDPFSSKRIGSISAS